MPICQLRPVTAALVVAQVALYVREHLSPRQHPYSSKCGLIPERVRKGEGYRLLTSNFVHKSELHLLVRHCTCSCVWILSFAGVAVMRTCCLVWVEATACNIHRIANVHATRCLAAYRCHLAFLVVNATKLAPLQGNMQTLLILGGILEPLQGSLRFGAVYVTSALASSAVSLLTIPPDANSMGASGCLCGLLASSHVLAPLRKTSKWQVVQLLSVSGASVALTALADYSDGRLGMTDIWCAP